MSQLYDAEYWGFILFAVVVALAGGIFLYFSRYRSRYETGAGAMVSSGEGTVCSAPMEVTRDGRLVVYIDGKHPFMIDTAYDFNVVSPEMDEWNRSRGLISPHAGKGQTMTVVTTTRTEAEKTVLPAGSLSKHGTCSFPASKETIVSRAAPPKYAGILGRAFLEAPGINNVLLDLKNGHIVFNANPSKLGRIIYTSKARDPRFGLFLIDVAVMPRNPRNQGFGGQFVLDTGARFLIVDQSHSNDIHWSDGSPASLNMSGHVTSTEVFDAYVSFPNAQRKDMKISFVRSGAAPGSILNRTDGPMGLIGVEAFRDYKILIDSASNTLCILD